MPGRGPAPNARHQRASDTKRRIDDKVIHVPSVAFPDPPRIPRGSWSAATRRWWKGWTSSPQAHTFTSTDWLELETTLYLVEAFYSGDLKVAAEIRLRVSKWGATPEDRARLRLKFVPAEETEAPKLASVRPIDSKRKRSLED